MILLETRFEIGFEELCIRTEGCGVGVEVMTLEGVEGGTVEAVLGVSGGWGGLWVTEVRDIPPRVTARIAAFRKATGSNPEAFGTLKGGEAVAGAGT